MTSSPLTVVYNPRAVIPHAASLRQAFAHCGRFSTAAIRRCPGSVSVPVVGAMLSHPLSINAMVSHYPTIKLIPNKPLLRRNHTFDPKILSGITRSFPRLFPTRGYVTYPLLRRLPLSAQSVTRRILQKLLARLACLIHAANVHSEPGSNPSNVCPSDIKPLLTETQTPRRTSAPGNQLPEPMKAEESLTCVVPVKERRKSAITSQNSKLKHSAMLSKNDA